MAAFDLAHERSPLHVSEARILDLLSENGPTDDFQTLVGSLRHEGELDEHRLALVDAAQRLKTMIDTERRYARIIAALNDTAADLAARRNLNDVLNAICCRSRTLFGTDVAYIMLQDERRSDTYVRATDGAVSEQFKTLRLPPGVGLGALVADRALPIATSNYLGDERFAHTPATDACVAGEGLRAIVGVPLRRGEQTVGVLLTGSRLPRHFEPGEIALFQALATHAAIAIENARLFTTAAQSYAELEAANRSIRLRNRLIEAAGTLHEQLAQLVVEGGGPADVLESVASMIGGALVLVDPDGGILAHSGDTPAANDATAPFEIAISAGPDRLGTLRWCSENETDRELAEQLLQRSTVILAGQLLSRRASSEADLRERAQLVSDLFDRPDINERQLDRDAVKLGIALRAPHVVLVAELGPGATHWLTLNAARAVGADGAIRVRDTEVRALISGRDPQVIAASWLDLLTTVDAQRPTIGVSRVAEGLRELRQAHNDAVNALGLLQALGRNGTAAAADQLGVFGFVFGHCAQSEIDVFLDRVLGPLLAYDRRRRDGRALATAAAYFEQRGHLNNIARALGIHINTLYARLDRITELLGVGWRDGDRALELQLALRLHAVSLRLGAQDHATTRR